jgi:hypothetical protein
MKWRYSQPYIFFTQESISIECRQQQKWLSGSITSKVLPVAIIQQGEIITWPWGSILQTRAV